MEQRYNGNGSITIWIDGEQIRTMEQNELGVYHTPGSSQVYLSSNANFMHDRCVADTEMLLDTLGYDFSDGLTADDVAELTVHVDA